MSSIASTVTLTLPDRERFPDLKSRVRALSGKGDHVISLSGSKLLAVLVLVVLAVVFATSRG